MVGEIRDLETADIAIKAAQTGHMVLSTLHTNDAPHDAHAPARTWASRRSTSRRSVILITAQRLARRLCANCKAPADIPHETLLDAGFKEEDVDGTWTPYRAGRLLDVQQRLQGPGRHLPGDADQRGHAAHHPGRRQRARDRQAGRQRKACASLRQSGLHKVRLGVTSLEEVLGCTNEYNGIQAERHLEE